MSTLKKGLVTSVIAVFSLFVMVGLVSAHATVQPKTVNADSYEVFVLRVPNEKEAATVQVKVEVPEGFAVSRVQPVPGWTYEVTRDADGKSLTAITWTDGKIRDGEFQDFALQGKTHATPGKYAWRVYQTYEDGEVVAWAGASDSNKPASVMVVKAAAATSDAHGQEQTTAEPATTAPAEAPSAEAPSAPVSTENPITAAAAYGGLLLGAGALILALRRK